MATPGVPSAPAQRTWRCGDARKATDTLADDCRRSLRTRTGFPIRSHIATEHGPNYDYCQRPSALSFLRRESSKISDAMSTGP